MEDLLEIRKRVLGEKEVNSISTRELHEFLEIKRDYTTWIKNRLNQTGSIEGEDYVITLLPKTGEEKRGGFRKDYIVTTSIGKHLSMMEKNEKGMEARRYFISVEEEFIAQLQKPVQVEDILGYGERSTNGFIKDHLVQQHFRSNPKSPLAIAEKKLAELYNYRDGLIPEAFKDLIFIHEKLVLRIRKEEELKLLQ